MPKWLTEPNLYKKDISKSYNKLNFPNIQIAAYLLVYSCRN